MGKTCPASLKWWGLWPAKVFLVLVLLLLFVSSKLQKSIWLKEPGQDLCKTGRQWSVLWNLYFTHFFLSTHGAPSIHLFLSLVEHPPFHLLFPPMEHPSLIFSSHPWSTLHSSFLFTCEVPTSFIFFFPPVKYQSLIFPLLSQTTLPWMFEQELHVKSQNDEPFVLNMVTDPVEEEVLSWCPWNHSVDFQRACQWWHRTS